MAHQITLLPCAERRRMGAREAYESEAHLPSLVSGKGRYSALFPGCGRVMNQGKSAAIRLAHFQVSTALGRMEGNLAVSQNLVKGG